MHKKHIFLSIFSKIAIFACVFCTLSAWAETTTCDIDFTPVTGNSWQNGTPTPTAPVEIESVGTKVGNKYAVQVAVNYDGGVVDLGTLNWSYLSSGSNNFFYATLPDAPTTVTGNIYRGYCNKYNNFTGTSPTDFNAGDKHFAYSWQNLGSKVVCIVDKAYTDATAFKQANSGVKFYYQRATDPSWSAPTTTPIYLNAPLRKVGDYADVLDYKNGTITRNVGVKVLDGTENYRDDDGENYIYFTPPAPRIIGSGISVITTHFDNNDIVKFMFDNLGWRKANLLSLGLPDTTDGLKAWFAQQYAKGTPVIIYYPLATPVVEQIENWSCIPPITEIKIATTKMVDEEFAAAEANLAATVQTIESVVSRTITQTGQIATLQAEKQTRPDESCPANMKCLLVQDEDGTPHWYPIIEP